MASLVCLAIHIFSFWPDVVDIDGGSGGDVDRWPNPSAVVK